MRQAALSISGRRISGSANVGWARLRDFEVFWQTNYFSALAEIAPRNFKGRREHTTSRERPRYRGEPSEALNATLSN
jgi:hypothetical protein